MSFKSESAKIQKKQGVSENTANKELAAGAQKASAKAQKANPKLLKVSGVKKK
jgi:hypothetical protein